MTTSASFGWGSKAPALLLLLLLLNVLPGTHKGVSAFIGFTSNLVAV